MTSGNASMQRSASVGEVWSTRALIARHKRAALGALAGAIILLGLLAAGIVSSSAGAVSDKSTCSAWSSANQDQQTAYAALYVREHGPLANGARDAASVKAAIDRGCLQAFGSDAADLVNVYQAINRQY